MRPPKYLGEPMTLPVELGFESPYTNKAKRMRPLEGTVVYIHPEGRYFTLEFHTGKGRFRQSYCCVPEALAFSERSRHEGWRRLKRSDPRPEEFLPGPVPRSVK